MSVLLALLKKLTPTQILMGLLLSALAVQTARVAAERHAKEAAQAEERVSHLDALNAQALLDSTKKLTSASLKALGDSLVVYQRQSVQVTQKASQLDHELGLLNKANYGLTVKLDSVSAQAVAPVVVSADSLSAKFHVKQAPYTVEADVSLRRIGTGRIDLSITQDPLGLLVKLGCGPEVRGVRPASVSVLAPKYATVRLDSLSQDPGVCSPAPLVPPSHPARAVALVVFGAILGWVIH